MTPARAETVTPDDRPSGNRAAVACDPAGSGSALKPEAVRAAPDLSETDRLGAGGPVPVAVGCGGVFRFDPAAIYSVEHLDAALAGITSARALLDRLAVPRRLKHGVLGADILRAIERAASEPEARPAPVEVVRTGRRGRPRKVPQGLEPVTAAELGG